MNLKNGYVATLISVLVCSILFLPKFVLAEDLIKGAFGMNLHLRQRIPQADWDTVMDRAEQAGVQWGREEFNWDVIEPSDNDYSFEVYDAVIAEYQDRNMGVVGLLTYSSSWASSNTSSSDAEFYPPDATAWEDYISTVVEHYSDDITYWEIWNEPNYTGFWKSNVTTYADYLEIAAAAIHEANPQAKVVLGGLSGADTSFLEALYIALDDPNNTIDVVAIHPYRVVDNNFNYAPETIVNGLNSLPTDIYNIKALMQQYNQANVPLWLTEVGWTTATAGVTKREQAEYLMRLYVMALAIPQVDKVFWYSMVDGSADASYSDAHFGLLDSTYQPKAAWSAYQFVQQHLNRRYFIDQRLAKATGLDDFSKKVPWEFTGTVCTDAHLQYTPDTLEVRYAFTGTTNCYLPVHAAIKLPNTTTLLQFKAQGEADDTFLRVRITDATGETYQYNLGYLPKEWLNYTVDLKQPSSHWNGDNDGVLDYPLTFDAFILDDTDGSRSSGLVYFDDLQASPATATFLYRFHQDNKDIYAYWTKKKGRKRLVYLTGAGKIQVKRWGKATREQLSGNGYYRIRSGSAVKFLQTQ